MHRLVICLFFILIRFQPLHAQQLKVTVAYTTKPQAAYPLAIPYVKGGLLTIKNFQSIPELDVDAVAITQSGFGYNLGFRRLGDEASININVYCHFHPNKSWMKAEGKNAYILSHEQLHFDISYLIANRFIQKLKGANFTVTNYKSVINSIYNEMVNEMHDYQLQYDTQTNNAIDKVAQADWKKSIQQQLEAL
ncbi:MAG: DUF922 domain-containing protein [Ferruginibacter sp.]